MELSPKRKDPEDVAMEKRSLAGKTGQGKNLHKEQLCKSQENIALGDNAPEDAPLGYITLGDFVLLA